MTLTTSQSSRAAIVTCVCSRVSKFPELTQRDCNLVQLSQSVGASSDVTRHSTRPAGRPACNNDDDVMFAVLLVQ
jgi:hypothetical protein